MAPTEESVSETGGASRAEPVGERRVDDAAAKPGFPLWSRVYPQEKASGAWARFRQHMPLTNAELQVIANNVAPYAGRRSARTVTNHGSALREYAAVVQAGAHLQPAA
jgi:hypothetical protein